MVLYGIKRNGSPLGICVFPYTWGMNDSVSYDVELDQHEDIPWFSRSIKDAEKVNSGLGDGSLSEPKNPYHGETKIFEIEVTLE